MQRYDVSTSSPSTSHLLPVMPLLAAGTPVQHTIIAIHRQHHCALPGLEATQHNHLVLSGRWHQGYLIHSLQQTQGQSPHRSILVTCFSWWAQAAKQELQHRNKAPCTCEGGFGTQNPAYRSMQRAAPKNSEHRLSSWSWSPDPEPWRTAALPRCVRQGWAWSAQLGSRAALRRCPRG